MNPAIRESELATEKAAFDWHAFIETTYNDVNDPVGSLLVTGTGANRYTKQDWSLRGGVRRKNSLGGEVEASQRIGRQEDNSRFLAPNPQGATRLELQYTQPLLKGAGQAYNQSLIVLAQVQLGKSSDTVAGELEDHLVKVTEAYWELYRTRAIFLQRRKLLGLAQAILNNLEARREFDAVQRQVFRARTAVANRESEMLRAEKQIRDWQSRLRLLVNDPALVSAGHREFMPWTRPCSGRSHCPCQSRFRRPCSTGQTFHRLFAMRVRRLSSWGLPRKSFCHDLILLPVPTFRDWRPQAARDSHLRISFKAAIPPTRSAFNSIRRSAIARRQLRQDADSGN